VTMARVDVHRLNLLIRRALTLVDASPARDQIWQVAGDIIQGVPQRVQDIETSLDRTSYALAVMGEGFLRGRLPLDDRYLVDEGNHSNPITGPREKDSMAARVASRHMAITQVAPSAEGQFVDSPDKREVRQFAQSGAVSNSPDVAAIAVKHMLNCDITVGQARSDARRAPPMTSEILEEDGAQEVNTLIRRLVRTEQPGVTGVPQSRDDLPKHPKLPIQRTRP
jgi:hypothetical protein